MKKVISFYFYIFILLCLCISCTTKHTELKNLSVPILSFTLSSEDVTAFVMDKNGYMWIGTSDGLNLSDGKYYRQYFYVPGDSSSLAGNQIEFLFKDSWNRIWIGTESGVCQYVGDGKFKTIPIPQKYGKTFQIIENSQKEIFFVTSEALLLYDKSVNHCEEVLRYSACGYNTLKFFIDKDDNFWEITIPSIRCYTRQFKEVFTLPNSAALNIVNAIIKDNCIWSAGGNGLLKYDISNRMTTIIQDSINFNKSDIVPRNIVAYKDKIWLVAKNSIYSYSEETHDFLCEDEMTSLLLEHYSSLVSTMYVDSHNDLWIGFPNGGYTNLKRLSNNAALHHHLFIDRVKDASIRSLSVNENFLWGIQGNNDVFAYDLSLNKFSLFKGTKDIEGVATRRFQHKLNDICCIQDKIWLLAGTRLMRYNYTAGKLNLEKVIRLGMQNISVGNFCTDGDHNLYVTTNINSLFKLSPDKDQIDKIPVSLPAYSTSSCIRALSSGQILICTHDMQFAYYQMGSDTIQSLDITTTSHTKGVIPTCIYEDKQKGIWIGTNKGLYFLDIHTNKLTHLHSVPNIYISSIVEEKKDKFWLGTHQGIVEYIPHKDKIIFYPTTAASQEKYRVFNRNSACMLQDSIFFFGHTRGCSVFTPSAMAQSSMPVVHLEKILISRANEISGIDIQSNPVESIHLKYNENDLTICFSTINFAFTPQFSCFYKMEGFDPDWIESNENLQAIYSNLPAGSYTFRVKLALSEEDVFSEQQIQIAVDKAPWASTPAVIFYIAVIVGIVFYINRLYLHIKSDRMAMRMLQRDREREHTTNQMNMDFFANISHEFRNPLTMILGPVTTMKCDKSLSMQNHQMLNIISRSISQMLKLIDQMLDFNKLENDALKMQVGQYDIVDEIANWVETFRVSAMQKSIKVEYSGLESSFFTWLDKDKLDKILSNLFTNALKHTPQNGSIKIGLECVSYDRAMLIVGRLPVKAERYIYIYVQDSGRGIPDNQLNDIFKRYYQIDNKSGLKYANWGTGIGLYYVKRLVQLHHGEVKADNVQEPEHTGAIFHVLFPIDEEAYIVDERQTEDKKNLEILEMSSSVVYVPPCTDPSKPYMLIVDDDTQVAFYLKTLFDEDYNVINKYSAESALAALETVEPDIILSDVVMGEMSGYEFCRNLKESRLHCHIPVILLTAKTQIGEQIEGLNIGASAYVTKPFDPNYLKALVKSLLRNRDSIRALLLSSSSTSQIVTNALSPQDMAFMKDLYVLMDSMITQDNLNFNMVAEKLYMSRSKFNYKLKGLTGETPIHFFLKYKLNKAAELLKSGKYNVSEVADITGFGTLSHFSVSFKKYFGVNPSEYK